MLKIIANLSLKVKHWISIALNVCSDDALIKHHENELRMKQDLVDYYKDLKTKMSTKMVGETLEQPCSTTV